MEGLEVDEDTSYDHVFIERSEPHHDFEAGGIP